MLFPKCPLNSGFHLGVMATNMMKRKSVGLILATLLLVTFVTSVTGIYAQQQDPPSASTQKFVAMATQARDKAYEFRAFVSEEIGSIPDEIEALFVDADALLAEGSIPKTIQAMNKYRSAYKHLHRFLEHHGVDMDAPDKARGILVAINRTYRRIDRYNTTLLAIKEILPLEQYNTMKDYVECVQGNLTEATNSLLNATESLLSPANVTWAAHNLTEANHNIHEAITCLRRIAKGFNRWRLEHFLTKVRAFRERIQDRIREKLRQGTLGDVLEKHGYSNMEDFHQTIEDLIASARENVEDLKTAIHDLKTILEKLREMDHHIPNHQGPP